MFIQTLQEKDVVESQASSEGKTFFYSVVQNKAKLSYKIKVVIFCEILTNSVLRNWQKSF